jgi:hypothetical protein
MREGMQMMVSCIFSFSSSYPMFTAQVPSFPAVGQQLTNLRGQANTGKKRLNFTHSTKSHSPHRFPHISTSAL